MNKIFNPNNIFAFPLKAYDLQNVFFCKELLKERFFCISEDYESSFYRSPKRTAGNLPSSFRRRYY